MAGLRIMVFCALATQPLAAQVGYPPEESPYRDIRKGHTLTAQGSYFGGSGGQFNIGPHKGTVFGGRYDIRTGSTIQVGLGLSHGNLDRFIIDPFVQLVNRRTGPVKQSVTFADLNLQLNVTGGKSWNRIAPFLAAGVGLAFAGGTPADTSDYDFGRKFYVAPSAGFRFFLSDRLHLRGEARAVFWKLNYPVTFQGEPPLEPGTPDDPNAVIVGDNLSEWTASPWIQVGLGYAFSP
ncbi:MAG TPA: hypothetical protein VJ808_13700 [Gemmatimonadales bacterium]|nr:hypothetical protein [Gemmatimonadales bacterium]